MRYKLLKTVPLAPFPNFHFFDQFGQYIFISSPVRTNKAECIDGDYIAECFIPSNFFNTGFFSIGIALTFDYAGIHVSFFEQHALNITIIENMATSLSRSSNFAGEVPGVVRPLFNWNIIKTE